MCSAPCCRRHVIARRSWARTKRRCGTSVPCWGPTAAACRSHSSFDQETPMRLAVLTSGGDAPGMNAAVRTVAVVGHARGHEVLGVRHGYSGLLEADVIPLDLARVDGISRYGGTILGSSRSK